MQQVCLWLVDWICARAIKLTHALRTIMWTSEIVCDTLLYVMWLKTRNWATGDWVSKLVMWQHGVTAGCNLWSSTQIIVSYQGLMFRWPPSAQYSYSSSPATDIRLWNIFTRTEKFCITCIPRNMLFMLIKWKVKSLIISLTFYYVFSKLECLACIQLEEFP
jgi:hypothetical protein